MIGALLAASLFLQPASWLDPDASDFRFQMVTKVDGEKDWPFIATSGKLACVRTGSGPVVMFIPADDDDGAAILDANPYAMLLGNMAKKKEFLLPYGGKLEELIRRIAPFVAMGHMLCKQNKGPIIPGGEL